MKKIFLFCICYIFFLSPVFAEKVLVENVFSDIDADYKYRDELQLFYDRGMIFPDEQGRFRPYELLDRDEFVGISMEVICKRCIQPHTKFEFVEKYLGEDVYFDIDSGNKYFYCVADADANNFVKWYDAGFQCDDGTQRDNERPFCSNNNITLEEAIAVILRNSGIFTIVDNEQVRQDIIDGKVTKQLSDDVYPKNSDGTPYTFYGYFTKAIDFELVEYDAQGNKKVYTMIDMIDNKIRPKKSISKEEFLRIAYVALKSNSCTEVVDNQLALAIDVWEKSCQEGQQDCAVSDLSDPDNIYDFTPDVEWACDAWIDDPSGYIWRFYNLTNGEEFFHYGTYLDNIALNSSWEWRVYLTVRDNCGNTGSVYSTIMVQDDSIDVEIDIVDADCTRGQTDCTFSGLDNPDDTYDFLPDVETTCTSGIPNPDGYDRTFTHEPTGEVIKREGDYIDNFSFLAEGRRRIYLEVQDNCGNTGSDVLYVTLWKESQITDPDEWWDIGLNVDIIADPIIWYENLLVDFQWVTYGGTPPFRYVWDFWDASWDYGKYTEHLYTSSRVFEVLLTVTDKNDLTGTATTLIKVLEADSCEVDTDNDGIQDCDDICPTIAWPEDNNWCPNVEIACGQNCSCPDGYTCSVDDPQVCPAEWYCTPIVQKETTCLYSRWESAIFWNASCASCPCNNFLDFQADLRECDIVFPAITSPDARDIYSRGNLWQITDK